MGDSWKCPPCRFQSTYETLADCWRPDCHDDGGPRMGGRLRNGTEERETAVGKARQVHHRRGIVEHAGDRPPLPRICDAGSSLHDVSRFTAEPTGTNYVQFPPHAHFSDAMEPRNRVTVASPSAEMPSRVRTDRTVRHRTITSRARLKFST